MGADEFCSIYNAPIAGVCMEDPNYPEPNAITGEGWMPSWCFLWPNGNFCPGTEPILNEQTGLNWPSEICFDSTYKKIPCPSKNDRKCFSVTFDHRLLDSTDPMYNVPCDWLGTCFTLDDVPVSCNAGSSGNFITFISEQTGMQINYINTINPNGKCQLLKDGIYHTGDCLLNIKYVDMIKHKGTTFDLYMRLTDSTTFVPITNEYYEGGYPIAAVYPPEPEPEPIPSFDPGPNPFDPTMPDPVEGQECATIVCECIALVVNALGAVNNTILKVDQTLLGMVDQLDSIVTKMPITSEESTLDLLPVLSELGSIDDKLAEILTAINDISVNVTEEAATNFWDVLGGAFGDIFDLIEFLIEKVIYLVVPEDTSSINQAFDQLNGLIMNKMQPVDQVKTAINQSINVEKQEFEDISVVLPEYGEVKFFESEYLMMAIPQIQRVMSAIMILLTAIYAYRKVSSEMIK